MRRLLVAFALVLAVAGPLSVSTAEAQPRQQECRPGNGQSIGRIAGAVVGGVIGGLLGGRRNRGASVLVGSLVGTLVGGELGNLLDRCEQMRVQATTLEVANNPGIGSATRREWRSETRPNVYGTVEAGERVTRSNGRECRTIRKVSYIDGQERTDSNEVCRRPPSSEWA